MKRLLALVMLLLLAQNLCAQPDTLRGRGKFVCWIDKSTSTKAYQMTYIGVPLVVGALIVKSQDDHFRSLRQSYVPAFRHRYDDYLQYSPAVLMVGLKAVGVRSRSSWGRMLVSDAFSAGIMAAAVNAVKASADVMRPDGSTANSFPSGHTATAFMCATMLHKEYGGRSPWYSIAGYSAATFTGLSRMLNNRHWLSDVMAGAGIGILSTELGYYFADLIFKDKGIADFSILETFDRTWNPSFLGFYLGFNVVPGHYHPLPGMSLNFQTGSTVGVEGAWFFTPHFGAGGELALTNIPFTMGDVAQIDPLKSVSAYLGAYFSYPISGRWMAGAKALAGYYHYDSYSLPMYGFGDTGNVTACGGISMRYRAKRNMSLRFFCDYKVAPPISRESSVAVHMINFGSSIDIVF